MNSKKIPLILIAVAFFISAICACYFLFTVSEVKVDFSVSENIPAEEIKDKLNQLKGKSVLFFDEDKVYEITNDYPLLKVENLQVKTPNVLSMKISERIPFYKLTHNSETYLLDEEGVALFHGQGDVPDRDLINLKLDGVCVTEDIVLGKKTVTDNDEIFYNALAMAKEVDLTDSIKEITINYLLAGENRDVVFNTYTGVDITITKADIKGVEKAKKAFESYDSCTTDYIKSFNRILVVMQDDGEIKVTWTRN